MSTYYPPGHSPDRLRKCGAKVWVEVLRWDSKRKEFWIDGSWQLCPNYRPCPAHSRPLPYSMQIVE